MPLPSMKSCHLQRQQLLKASCWGFFFRFSLPATTHDFRCMGQTRTKRRALYQSRKNSERSATRLSGLMNKWNCPRATAKRTNEPEMCISNANAMFNFQITRMSTCVSLCLSIGCYAIQCIFIYVLLAISHNWQQIVAIYLTESFWLRLCQFGAEIWFVFQHWVPETEVARMSERNTPKRITSYTT